MQESLQRESEEFPRKGLCGARSEGDRGVDRGAVGDRAPPLPSRILRSRLPRKTDPSRRPRHLRAPARRRRHRGDHVVHEHLEPGRHARRRPPREEGGRARALRQAVGQDSLAPGSKVVTDYLTDAGLMPYLEALGFHLVGYGCTTCIGNSGPLPDAVSEAVKTGDLVVAGVLSGNRNFEGRINPQVRMNYLASPPLVVAYALAGEMDIDLTTEPLGTRPQRRAGLPQGHLADAAEVLDAIRTARQARAVQEGVRRRLRRRRELAERSRCPKGRTFVWEESSTYVRKPPFFDDIPKVPAPVTDIAGARVLALLGDSVTTDHISPAGNIAKNEPRGEVPHRARRRARGLQLLRRAPRQPRGDDARHLRQHPPQEPAARRAGGRTSRSTSRAASRCRSTTRR